MRDHCDICRASIPPHEHFLVRIDVFADPAVPAIDTEGDEAETSSESIERLIEAMKSMTADDLQDGVHRRFEYRICAACQKAFLANPLGLPRVQRDSPGEN
jgi:hypothetical protein